MRHGERITLEPGLMVATVAWTAENGHGLSAHGSCYPGFWRSAAAKAVKDAQRALDRMKGIAANPPRVLDGNDS